MTTNEPKCSFCGRTKKEVHNFVEGMEKGEERVLICENCIMTASKIVDKAKKTQDDDNQLTLTPREIYEKLCEYVIGQERSKKILSVEVREHYKRINAPRTNYVEMEKSNVLMIGPTGCGKTLLVKSIAKILDVPFAIGDATTFTQAGYVGNDVESILTTLLINSDFDVAKAERGICFIDEIDKVSRKSESASLTRDVSGEGVQQALLKMVEGSECIIPADGSTRKHPHQQSITFDTANVLFIFGGSFDGLADIIKKRVSKGSSVGFNGIISPKSKSTSVNDFFPLVSTEDLVKFGMIPELLGRIPIHVSLDELSGPELKKILVEPKNSLVKQMQFSYQLDGVALEFTDESLDLITERAIKLKTGARGLRSIVKGLLLESQYELPEKGKAGEENKIIIDGEITAKIFNEIDRQTIGKVA